MGKKGGSKQLKRMPAPKIWPIPRKGYKWIVMTRPGPHSIEKSFPLLIIIRDILKLANNRREAKLILSEGNVKIDGKIRREDDYPVGFMDVIEISGINKTYRLLPIQNKGMTLHPITGEEKEFKLCKIINKTTVKKGNLQLNLHDGRNIIVKIADHNHPVEDVYSTSDLLKIKIPSSEILEHLKFREDVLALVTGGKNIGRLGKIVKIKREANISPTITLQDVEEQFETVVDYVFPIGRGEPWISIPMGE